jgi:hypothetical protein
MARYRSVDMSPRFLPIVLEEQRVPGTFADAVNQLVDILDLSAFDAHHRNDRHTRHTRTSDSTHPVQRQCEKVISGQTAPKRAWLTSGRHHIAGLILRRWATPVRERGLRVRFLPGSGAATTSPQDR